MIDFIDMEENRNNRAVERKMKDCLKHDRARIQVGRISHFGLMEMSRQRIRQGVLESSTEVCPTCGGTGHMRSVSSVALHLLRALEEQLQKSAANDLIVRTRPDTALYLLNHKRAHLRDLEGRFGVAIIVQSDGTLSGQQYFVVEKGGAASGVANPTLARPGSEMSLDDYNDPDDAVEDDIEEEESEEVSAESIESTENAEGEEQPKSGEQDARRRRRRGRRGGRGRERTEKPNRDPSPRADTADGETQREELAAGETQPVSEGDTAHERHHAEGDGQQPQSDGERKRRRRGRRGGRRNRRDRPQNGEQPRAEQNDANGNFTSAEFDEIDTTPQPETREPQPEARPSFPVNPGTAPQFATEQPASTPAPEHAADGAQKRRSTVREAPPAARFDDGAPSGSVYERTDSPPLASENGDQESSPAPGTSSSKKGWWRR